MIRCIGFKDTSLSHCTSSVAWRRPLVVVVYSFSFWLFVLPWSQRNNDIFFQKQKKEERKYNTFI